MVSCFHPCNLSQILTQNHAENCDHDILIAIAYNYQIEIGYNKF